MNARTLLMLSVAGALCLSACSLLLDFDPEGQPCDASGACLEGYGCVEGRCVLGADAGIDCAQCPSGRCFPDRNECLPNTCEFRICNATFYCDEDGGVGPTCKSVAPDTLGGTCYSDTGCGVNRRCMLGAIQAESTGNPRGGFCVESCGPLDTCPMGSVCRGFPLGLDAGETRVCLPSNAVYSCVNDQSCVRPGQPPSVCTVFDHPEVGPIKACDAPLSVGAQTGEPCARDRDAGTFCVNGLCVPPTPEATEPSVCANTCDATTCPAGQTCTPVPFAVQKGGVIRYVPMCVTAQTACVLCTATPDVCGVDAPYCENFGGEGRCFGACTPGAGSQQCADGYSCMALDAGTNRCVPTSFACP